MILTVFLIFNECCFNFICFFFSVIAQSYTVNIMDEHVLRGNTGILKCHIPSFVSDFVFVSSWIETDGTEYFTQTDNNFQTGTY